MGTSISTSNRESSIAIGGIVGVSLGLSLSLGHVYNQTIDAYRGRGAQTGVTSSMAKAIRISSIGTSTISTSTINTSTINTSTIGTSNWKASIAICGIVRVGFGLSHSTSGQT